MKYVLALMVLLLSSCASYKPIVESEFAPYLESFYEEGGKLNYGIFRTPITIKMVEKFEPGEKITEKTIGLCLVRDGNLIVEVKREFWVRASNSGRKALIFHELGHCILGRDHNDIKLPDGKSASLMHSELYIPGDKEWDYYTKEFYFSRCEWTE